MPDLNLSTAAPEVPELDLAEHTKLKCPKCDEVQAAGNKTCKKCGHDLSDARKAKFANMAQDGEHQAILLGGTNAPGVYLADEMPGGDLFWKVACKTGTLALSPGPGQVDVEKPLQLTDDMFDHLKLAFEEQAFPHVTVPETHGNGVLENTGYVRRIEILDHDDERLPEQILAAHANDPDGTKLLMAGIEFTEPDVKKRAENGSIPDTSVGVKFNYRNKRTGKLYPAALEHIALTSVPWVDGLSAFSSNAMLGQQPFDAEEGLVPFDGFYVDLDSRVNARGAYDEDKARAAIAALGTGDEWSWDWGVRVMRLDSEKSDEGVEAYWMLSCDSESDKPPRLFGSIEELVPVVSAEVSAYEAKEAARKSRADSITAYSAEPETDLALGAEDPDNEGDGGQGGDIEPGSDLAEASPDGSLPIDLSAAPKEDTATMTVEELLAQQQARAEAAEARVAALETQLSLGQNATGEVLEELHLARVDKKITTFEGKVPPAVLVRAKALMLADKPKLDPAESLQLSVNVPGDEAGEFVEKQFGVSEIVEYLLSALPAPDADAARTLAGLHLALEDTATAQHKEKTASEQVDEWEKQTHPERFDGEGNRITAAA